MFLPVDDNSPNRVKFQPVLKERQPAHQRVVNGLREQIMKGKFAPGTQLPGERVLAAAWKTSSFTVHLALRTLMKEGWIDRRPSAGTFTADPKNRFLTAAIYYPVDLSLDTMTSYSRNLHFSLLGKLNRLRKKTQVFIDSRPEEQQDTPLPELEEAYLQRRIQCVIAPSLNAYNLSILTQGPIPSAVCIPCHPRGVQFDSGQFLREGLKQLVAARCRSVGLITTVARTEIAQTGHVRFHELFQRVVEEVGLPLREDWIRSPEGEGVDFETFGYREFKNLRKLRSRPDGLIVYPDTAARGVVMAVLELGVKVPREMKFVFHRNAHVRFLCPFSVTWGISNEDDMAAALISKIQMQFNGEELTETLVPYTFAAGPAVD